MKTKSFLWMGLAILGLIACKKEEPTPTPGGPGSGSTPVAVTGVTLDKDVLVLTLPMTDTLTATVTPDNADNKNVKWISLDESVATVKNGIVSPVDMGDTEIIVETLDGEFRDTCEVSVYYPAIGSTIICDKEGNAVGDTLVLNMGESVELSVKVLPEICPQDEWDWSYDLNQEVVSIDEVANVFTAKKEGVTTIKAEPWSYESSTVLDEVVIKVIDPVLRFTYDKESIFAGQELELTTNKPVKTWSLSRLSTANSVAAESYIEDGKFYAGLYRASGEIANEKIIISGTTADGLSGADTLTVMGWEPMISSGSEDVLAATKACIGVGSTIRIAAVNAEGDILSKDEINNLFTLKKFEEVLVGDSVPTDKYTAITLGVGEEDQYSLTFETAHRSLEFSYYLYDYMLNASFNKPSCMAGNLMVINCSETIVSARAIYKTTGITEAFPTAFYPHSQKQYIAIGMPKSKSGYCNASMYVEVTTNTGLKAIAPLDVYAFVAEVYLVENPQTPSERLLTLSKNPAGKYEVSSGDHIGIRIKDLEDNSYFEYPGDQFDIYRGDPEREVSGWVYEDSYEKYTLFTAKSTEDFDYASEKDYEIRVTNTSGSDYYIPLSFSVSL